MQQKLFPENHGRLIKVQGVEGDGFCYCGECSYLYGKPTVVNARRFWEPASSLIL